MKAMYLRLRSGVELSEDLTDKQADTFLEYLSTRKFISWSIKTETTIKTRVINVSHIEELVFTTYLKENNG